MDNLNKIDITVMDFTQISDYKTYEIVLDMVMNRAVEDFVVIGYMLKKARDTNILIGSRYRTVTEMALDRYGLHKDQVSRYIAINDRFAENGYSPKLQSKYRHFGISKLQEMLLLPDSIINELSPEMTKENIQKIKKEVQEAKQKTDLEIMFEPQEAETLSRLSEKVLFKYFHENTYKYLEMYEAACRAKYGTPAKEAVEMVMAPSGIMSDFVRISGIGKILITLDAETGVFTFTNVRTGDKDSIDSLELLKIFGRLFTPTYSKDAKHTWKTVYNEQQYPEEAEDQEKQKIESVHKQKARVAPEQKEEKKKPEKLTNTELDEHFSAAGESKSHNMAVSAINDNAETPKEHKISYAKEPENVENTECEQHFTTQAPTYRDTVFNEMAAVAERLHGSIIKQDIKQIDSTLKDLRCMLDTIMKADENNDIIGQMNINDMEQRL